MLRAIPVPCETGSIEHLPCVGDLSGPDTIVPERARSRFLDPAVSSLLRKILSSHENPSHKPTVGNEANTQRVPCRGRFDFTRCERASLQLTLQHLLDFILYFRDDNSGAGAYGLTTWDPIHRAGPSR